MNSSNLWTKNIIWGNASLPQIDHFPPKYSPSCNINIAVVTDKNWTLASQFQSARSQMFIRCFPNNSTNLCGSSVKNVVKSFFQKSSCFFNTTKNHSGKMKSKSHYYSYSIDFKSPHSLFCLLFRGFFTKRGWMKTFSFLLIIFQRVITKQFVERISQESWKISQYLLFWKHSFKKYWKWCPRKDSWNKIWDERFNL